MRVRSWLSAWLLLCVAMPGCATRGTPDAGTPEAEGVVKGRVSYRERVALPPDAVVDLWIMDVSSGIVAQVITAEASVPTEGRQVPIPFEVRYDPARIAADHPYGIRAVIRAGGRTMFESEEPVLVITQGNPTDVDLWLRAAPR